MRHFNSKKLATLMESELVACNINQDSIRHLVASLIQASLRGVDSHGINLFPHYCRAVTAGRVNANPCISIARTGTATAVVDADHAFGHHAGAIAMQEAISLALNSGIGAVSVRNSTHFGAAAYFGLMAPERDCIGIVFTNADALVKAFGAREAFFGTNPICFTAPMATEGPFCLDMATSLVSWNKINNYRRKEQQIPEDWAFDEEGRSVTDPHIACSLNPVGGYKGFGLGMMVDILCAALAGGEVSKDIKAMYALPLDSSKRGISHFFIALDVSCFCGADLFRNSVQSMADRVRLLVPRDDGNEPMVAGDPEKRSIILRNCEGIPVDDVKYAEFLSINPVFESAVLL